MAKHTRQHPTTAPLTSRERSGSAADSLAQAAASNAAGVRLLLDPYQAAQALGINRSTLYALIQRDGFPSFTIGRRRCIPIKDLEAWIARQLAP